ncbi:XRE family transcriptional regulator [Geobacillus thermoleovorans]|uniref:helix-turn-helix transcriptional regulator n=1 Tax=Geobacillus thermoleovorans TaxID=33941 RepID=UPI00078D807E|nr:XRE family transcriptional regulator [Geobacillus thermoleovorans]
MKNKISYLLKEKGMKQNHVAKKMGVSEQTFSNWCRNITQPDLLQAYVLAKIIGARMDELIEDNEEGERK